MADLSNALENFEWTEDTPLGRWDSDDAGFTRRWYERTCCAREQDSGSGTVYPGANSFCWQLLDVRFTSWWNITIGLASDLTGTKRSCEDLDQWRIFTYLLLR